MWQPIETLPNDTRAILYQPENKEKFNDECMIIGSIRREKYGLMIDTGAINGSECECDLRNPSHWMLLPEPPK